MGTLIGNPHGHIRFRMRAPIKLPVTSWSVCSAAHVHRPGAPASGQKEPPAQPPSAKQYTDAGLPWFDYYGGDLKALEGAKELAKLDSVAAITIKKGRAPISGNEPLSPAFVKLFGPGKGAVSEGGF